MHKTVSVKNSDNDSCYIPTRYVLTFLTFWGMSLELAQRVCLSVTIVTMVNQTAIATEISNSNDTSIEDLGCSNQDIGNDTSSIETGKYYWTPSTQGIILGAYFYGYICTQIIGGRLSELFGSKWTLGLALVLSSLLTFVTPASADIGVTAIVFLRVFIGFCHGVCLPSAYAMFSQWAPDNEKSTLVSLCIVGDYVGIIIAMPLAGYLCEHGFAGGWPSTYYILGVLGIIWFIFWSCFAYNMPSDHPRISLKELNYIQEGRTNDSNNNKLPAPWKKLCASLPVWSIAICSFSSAWGYIALLTKLPTYLELILHVPIQKNGLVNSLIYVCTCITLFLSGYASDRLKAKTYYSITVIRKSFQTFASLGPALCLSLIPFVKCSRAAVIGLLVGATAMQGIAGGGHIGMSIDLAPRFAGTIFGIVNSVGSTAGFLAPLTAGFILDSGHNKIQQWNLVFYLTSAIYVIGYIIFMCCATADIQPWALPTKTEKSLLSENASINVDVKKQEVSINYGTIS